VTSSLLPVLILGFVIVSYIALRPFSSRVRYLFDLVCFVGASFVLFQHQTLPLPSSGGAANAAPLWLHAVAGIWWLLGARVLVAVMSFTLNHNRRWRQARLFPDLTAAAIYTAAVSIVLISVLALPIGGLLATSGVLAIVLGLALQNTLANVFAGIAFGIEAPFNVGDRISVGDKIEGTVVQMNWRSVRVLTDGDDVAIVPNSVVAKSDIVNRSFPTRVRSAFIELSCPGAANPERVIDTLQQATLLCPPILAVPRSSAVLTRLGSRESRYRVNFSVSDTEHLSSTKDLLLRHARRQLYYSGLYFPRTAQDAQAADDANGRPIPLLSVLQQSALFEGLEAEPLAELAAHLKPRSLAANSDLYAEFDRAARRGLAILNRVVAVRATEDSAGQSLLHRIRAFFDIQG
jgi:small-conductance mechanosensitive channel